MDFQAMFHFMGGVKNFHLWELQGTAPERGIDGNFTERRGESIGAGERQALNGDTMAGAQQNNPLDHSLDRLQVRRLQRTECLRFLP